MSPTNHHVLPELEAAFSEANCGRLKDPKRLSALASSMPPFQGQVVGHSLFCQCKVASNCESYLPVMYDPVQVTFHSEFGGKTLRCLALAWFWLCKGAVAVKDALTSCINAPELVEAMSALLGQFAALPDPKMKYTIEGDKLAAQLEVHPSLIVADCVLVCGLLPERYVHQGHQILSGPQLVTARSR
eukprot:4945259-Amphidinium_carterae.3